MRKGLPFDVSRFRVKSLMDVVNELASGQSITREELAEIAGDHNQVAMIREAILPKAYREPPGEPNAEAVGRPRSVGQSSLAS